MKPKHKHTSPPINVALPNTTEVKMVAIASVARAIENLSKALISTNVLVEIKNNLVTASKVGINVATQE